MLSLFATPAITIFPVENDSTNSIAGNCFIETICNNLFKVFNDCVDR